MKIFYYELNHRVSNNQADWRVYFYDSENDNVAVELISTYPEVLEATRNHQYVSKEAFEMFAKFAVLT